MLLGLSCFSYVKNLKPLNQNSNLSIGTILVTFCRIIQVMEALLQIQRAKLRRYSEELPYAERDHSQLLSELLAAKESYLRHRSRVKWLKEGDQNTRFFHNFVKGKLTRSRISSFVYSDGHFLTEENDIKKEILGLYMGLLGTEDVNCTGVLSLNCRVFCLFVYLRVLQHHYST